MAEKIVRSRVTAFWSEHQVLNPHQFGYLKGKSTLAQLLSCFHDWSSSRNNSKITDVVFFYLSKAFDSVPHERLLLKLNKYGIEGPLLSWFRQFLTNRQQRVGIRGTYSSWSAVTSGVPQGTILGPILFLIYVNDIPNIVKSSVKLFADTKIYRELSHDSDTSVLQSDLDSLEEWTRNWQVKFNPEKCEVMRISHKQDKSKHQYYLSDARLKCVDSYKDLGVIMSRDLSWSNHMNASVNKANKVLGLLKRTVGSKNREIFSILFRSLVRPILEYASPVWSPYLVKDKRAIESIQRRSSRIALGQKRREMSYEERCELLGWSTLERRREYFSLVECYKTVFELNGLECRDYFEFCNNNTRSNNLFKIRMKSAKANAFKYSFFTRIIKEWNNLPHHLFGNDININKFKFNLKKWMNIT